MKNFCGFLAINSLQENLLRQIFFCGSTLFAKINNIIIQMYRNAFLYTTAIVHKSYEMNSVIHFLKLQLELKELSRK